MLEATRNGIGIGDSAPTRAVANKRLVEMMHHQLLPEESWAKIFVAAMSWGPVLIRNLKDTLYSRELDVDKLP